MPDLTQRGRAAFHSVSAPELFALFCSCTGNTQMHFSIQQNMGYINNQEGQTSQNISTGRQSVGPFGYCWTPTPMASDL